MSSSKKAKYILTVGNIGNIAYSNKREAVKAFALYVECSKSLRGRAGGESVYLTDIQGNIISEHIGTSEDWDV